MLGLILGLGIPLTYLLMAFVTFMILSWYWGRRGYVSFKSLTYSQREFSTWATVLWPITMIVTTAFYTFKTLIKAPTYLGGKVQGKAYATIQRARSYQ